jgi:uncharacterized protein YjiS (DUF1127 family)
MIAEIALAALLAETARGAYYTWREQKRNRRSLDRFAEILKHSPTLEELSRNLYADRATNPELYKKVPQTWMVRLYEKLAKE